MSAAEALRRLQGFLRVLAAGLFAGTVAELLMAKHVDGPVQLIPFALCGAGLLSLALWWRRPGPATVAALRAAMAVVALGSLLGVYEHVAGNLGFVRETKPTADTRTAVVGTLTGRDPLLAPGILAVGAVLAIAGTAAGAVGAAAADERAGSMAGSRSRRVSPRGGGRPAVDVVAEAATVADRRIPSA